MYTRKGYQSFDNGTLVKGTSFTTQLYDDTEYSFRVTAVNDGGESFPSETLSCGISSKNRGTVLIMNCFTRLEGPKVIDTPSQAGFDIDADPGVPYGAFTCGGQRGEKAGSFFEVCVPRAGTVLNIIGIANGSISLDAVEDPDYAKVEAEMAAAADKENNKEA